MGTADPYVEIRLMPCDPLAQGVLSKKEASWRLWNIGFGIKGLGAGIEDLGFRIQDVGFRV